MKFHRKRPRAWVWLSSLFVMFTVCSLAQVSISPGPPITLPTYRQPMGIYARYGAGCSPRTDECIKDEVYALVSDPGIAGIDAALNWSDLNPGDGKYAWTDPSVANELQDIFDGVDEWNRKNSTAPPKTVQLDINAGFRAPQWLFDNLSSCDAMFGTGKEGTPSYKKLNTPNPIAVQYDCGKVTFYESENHGNPQYLPLPLPWNGTYTSAWAKFIGALAAQYGDNPDLVSVSIDGPTASSPEMILPNEDDDSQDFYKWNPLMGLTLAPSYQNTDQIFIEEWENAINLFSREFSGLTLVLTTGNGLPNFPNSGITVPPEFEPVCADPSTSPDHPNGDLMDCVAESTIIAYLADVSHGGNNLKSVQEDGMAASGVYHSPLGGGNLGSWGIRYWALVSQSGNAVLPNSGGTQISRMMGGFQSGGTLTPISSDIQEQGCSLPLSQCPILDEEQALYNFLASVFDGTSVGGVRGPGNYGQYCWIGKNDQRDCVEYAPNGTVSAGVPLNYLQLYWEDVAYYSQFTCIREGGECPDNLVVTGSGGTEYMDGPGQLEAAAQEFQQIADPPVVETTF